MLSRYSDQRGQSGFTLVELMATLAILGLIAMISVPIMGNVMNKAEDDADDISKTMIENAGKMADKDGLEFDNVRDETYKVTTLVDEGYIDLKDDDGLNKPENFVAKRTDNYFQYNQIPEYEPSPLSDFTWKNDGSKGIEITKYTGSDKKVRIPRVIDKKPVTKIGETAFGYLDVNNIDFDSDDEDTVLDGVTTENVRNPITDIKIPDTVTHIDDMAFASNQLSSVLLPSKLKHIGMFAFANNRLNKVDIPESLDSFSNGFGFALNQISEITLPDSMTHMGGGMFASNRLTSVNLPSNLTEIGNHSFSVNNITRLDIPNKVTHIGDSAFNNNKLSKLVIPKNVTQMDLAVFRGNHLKHVHIKGSPALTREEHSWTLFDKNDPDLVIKVDKVTTQPFLLGLIKLEGQGFTLDLAEDALDEIFGN